MAKTKIYFWLKLDKKFFENVFIKRLKNMSGGYAMTVIYIRLMLESLESDCILYYEGYFDSLIEELAIKLDVSEDDLKMTMAYFSKCGLIQVDTDGNAELPQARAMLEQETNHAKYKRELRQRQKADNVFLEVDNVHQMSTKCPPEKEIEIEKDIEIEKEKDIYKSFESELGRLLSPFEIDEIRDISSEYGAELSLEAMREAVKQGKAGNSWNYQRGILRNWLNGGVKTVDDLKRHRERRKPRGKVSGGQDRNSSSNSVYPELDF